MSSTWKVARSKRPTLVPLVAELPDAKGNLTQILKKFASKRKMKNPLVIGFPAKKGTFSWVKFLVPENEMLTWLQLSGAEEIYFRQFFDRKAMVNDRFKVMWLKGKAAVMQPCNIWEKLSPAEGFYGLVRTERGLGVRILKDGSAEPLIKILAEGPIRVREHPEDLKWWKFEKLSDEEMYDIHGIIHTLGLQLHGGVRKTRQRRFWRVTFQAQGTPISVSKDNDVSQAVLTELYPAKPVSQPEQSKPSLMAVDSATVEDQHKDLQPQIQQAIEPLMAEIANLKKQLETFASIQTDLMVLQVSVASLLEENKQLKELLSQNQEQKNATFQQPEDTQMSTVETHQPPPPPTPTAETDGPPPPIRKFCHGRGDQQKIEEQRKRIEEEESKKEQWQLAHAKKVEDSQPTASTSSQPPAPARKICYGRGFPPKQEEERKKAEEEQRKQQQLDPYRDYSRDYYKDPAVLAEYFPFTQRGRGHRGR